LRSPSHQPTALDHVAELGGEHHLFTLAPNRSAHQLLISSDAVDVGGIEKVDAQLEGAIDGRDRRGVVGGAVDRTHAHAAEPDGGDIDFGASEFPCFHVSPLECVSRAYTLPWMDSTMHVIRG
jgi:hypothetical protein